MIEAKIICHTQNPFCSDAQIYTVEYNAPRIILAEINTHGVFAKSAASSRAIPVKKRIEMVNKQPFVPRAFGKNKKGMQATETLEGSDAAKAEEIWLIAVEMALLYAEEMEEVSAHKQIANRILEPYSYVKGVLTATEWDNFFKLRMSKEAQPEFEELAHAIHVAMKASTPKVDVMHLPYTDGVTIVVPDDLLKISAARCARISYTSFEGKLSSPTDDITLCDTLLESGHMSPFQHQAYADTLVRVDGESGEHKAYRWRFPEKHERFWGWISQRSMMELEPKYRSRRDSFGTIWKT